MIDIPAIGAGSNREERVLKGARRWLGLSGFAPSIIGVSGSF